MRTIADYTKLFSVYAHDTGELLESLFNWPYKDACFAAMGWSLKNNGRPARVEGGNLKQPTVITATKAVSDPLLRHMLPTPPGCTCPPRPSDYTGGAYINPTCPLHGYPNA